MNRTQIVIIISGILLAVLLYRLPRHLVADSEQIKEEGPVASSTPVQNFKDTHQSSVSEKDLKMIESLKKDFQSVSDKEKKLIFADSISNLYKKAGLYDSFAVYSARKAAINPGIKNLEAAGDAYFEAFSAGGATDKTLNDKARYYYQQVLDKDQNNLDVKARMAMTYVATENPMQGISLLREVLQKDPENENALYNMGILSVQSGQYDKAVSRFEDLLKVNPEHANGRFYLGLALLNTGKTEKARKEFLKARELEKDPAFQAIVDGYLKDIGK